MLWKILELLLRQVNVSARAWTSATPEGRRLGGHDIPQLADRYLVIEIKYGSRLVLLGHLQYC